MEWMMKINQDRITYFTMHDYAMTLYRLSIDEDAFLYFGERWDDKFNVQYPAWVYNL